MSSLCIQEIFSFIASLIRFRVQLVQKHNTIKHNTTLFEEIIHHQNLSSYSINVITAHNKPSQLSDTLHRQPQLNQKLYVLLFPNTHNTNRTQNTPFKSCDNPMQSKSKGPTHSYNITKRETWGRNALMVMMNELLLSLQLKLPAIALSDHDKDRIDSTEHKLPIILLNHPKHTTQSKNNHHSPSKF